MKFALMPRAYAPPPPPPNPGNSYRMLLRSPAPIVLQKDSSPKLHLLFSHFILKLFSSLRASSEAFGHRKTLRRSVGVVDLLVVLSDSAMESLLEVAIIHVQSYPWLYCRLGCAARARGGRSHAEVGRTRVRPWARA